MVNAEHLQYFKDLIQGDDVPSWYKWWQVHEQELKDGLPRSDYLKLKFGKVGAASEVLRNAGIAFQWSPQGLRQAAYANLHPSVVDENGYPLPEVRAQAYGGTIAALLDGDTSKGLSLLNRFMRQLRRQPDELERAQDLAELVFDAEQIWQEGHRDAAVLILQSIANWETLSDLELPAVRRAREKLSENGEAW